MAALRKKRGLVLLAMWLLVLLLPLPAFSQDLLNPEHLFEIEDLTYFDSSDVRMGETAHTQPATEQVELPSMANPFPLNSALVLVGLDITSTREDRSSVLAEIYFDVKRYLLKREAAKIIEESAMILEGDKTRKIQIEAFCDTRGTTAYSLALGNHRAYAVTSYLHNLGIPSSQISDISFGSHPPRCTTNSPTCWQDNQRIDRAFHLLAMHQPQAGCLTRLRLNPERSDDSPTDPTTLHQFLQRIHLAESR